MVGGRSINWGRFIHLNDAPQIAPVLAKTSDKPKLILVLVLTLIPKGDGEGGEGGDG